MDFVLDLPKLKRDRDCIFMVVYKFSKMTYFISCHKIDDAINSWLHGVPVCIVAYHDVKIF